MADELTPNIGLIKPDVGASDDTWGEKLNYNFDLLDGRIPSDLGIYVTDAELAAILAGYATDAEVAASYAPISHTHTASQITDFAEATDDRVAALLIPGTNITIVYDDPTNKITINSTASGGGGTGDVVGPAGATADDIAVFNGTTGKIIKDGGKKVSDIAVPATAVPLVESGSGTVGTSVKYAREDHVHPTGGGGGGTSVTISDTPPGSPTAGSMWWESDTGILYIYYNDGTSSQWVMIGGSGAFAALNSPAFTGDPTAPTPPRNDNDFSIATTNWVNVQIGLVAQGQCQLTKSGANLLLSPYGGNVITVGSGVRYIPDGGLTLAPTGLTPSTFYYIYAVVSGFAVTGLEASTTVPVVATGLYGAGQKVKTGDITRVLVGAAYVVSGPSFADTDGQLLVLSYFNRRRKFSRTAFTTSRTFSSDTVGEVNSEIRANFITWADEYVEFVLGAAPLGSVAANQISSQIGFDGTTAGAAIVEALTYVAGASVYLLGPCQAKRGNMTENAAHFGTMLGRAVNGGFTATWDNRTALTVSVNG